MWSNVKKKKITANSPSLFFVKNTKPYPFYWKGFRLFDVVAFPYSLTIFLTKFCPLSERYRKYTPSEAWVMSTCLEYPP